MGTMPRLRGFRAVVAATLVLGATLSAAPATATGERAQRNDILIKGDSAFTAANGVRSGSGTATDPFVISGWDVWTIRISDTSKHVVIRDNNIQGQLVLNWNGPGVTVVNNRVSDLRVNQNVKRTGAATGGRIANNVFGIVGQLRHFDGVFENNTVMGSRSLFEPVFRNRSVNFDGFNGAVFRNNRINGYMDAKLHGHHHGSGFDADSHHHGSHVDHDAMDHTIRYHEVSIYGNEIRADGYYALRWTDAPHSVDDRTAASETNPDLNKEHVHYTRVDIADNELVGAGLMIDVFNADDQRHLRTERGTVTLSGNSISLEHEMDDLPWDVSHGISVERATDVTLRIVDNVVTSERQSDRDLVEKELISDAGIYLFDVSDADVLLRDNAVTGSLWGVRASQMPADVAWWIDGLRTVDVGTDVYYDRSVANPPKRTR